MTVIQIVDSCQSEVLLVGDMACFPLTANITFLSSPLGQRGVFIRFILGVPNKRFADEYLHIRIQSLGEISF